MRLILGGAITVAPAKATALSHLRSHCLRLQVIKQAVDQCVPTQYHALYRIGPVKKASLTLVVFSAAYLMHLTPMMDGLKMHLRQKLWPGLRVVRCKVGVSCEAVQSKACLHIDRRLSVQAADSLYRSAQQVKSERLRHVLENLAKSAKMAAYK